MKRPLTLHYAPDNASLCVRLALEDLNLPYNTILVDRARNEQRSEAYLRLNPNGLIPTLITPNGPIYETAAILLWLADQAPGTMFPAIDDPARGETLARLMWLSNTVHPALRMLFYPDQFAPGAEDILRTRTHARLRLLFDQLNADTFHLNANQPNIIACYIAPMLRWPALYGGDTTWFDLPRWPRLHAFAEAFEQRPAALRAALAEGLGPTPYSKPAHPNPPEGSAT